MILSILFIILCTALGLIIFGLKNRKKKIIALSILLGCVIIIALISIYFFIQFVRVWG